MYRQGMRSSGARAGQRYEAEAEQARAHERAPSLARIGSQGRSVRSWRVWFPIPLSIPCVRFPAHGLPMIFSAWLTRSRAKVAADQIAERLNALHSYDAALAPPPPVSAL
jgi:hypothetical protein